MPSSDNRPGWRCLSALQFFYSVVSEDHGWLPAMTITDSSTGITLGISKLSAKFVVG